MPRQYTESDLRSRLTKYANGLIESIQCNEGIHINFKEGYGTTLTGEYSTEISVSSIKEMKEACKTSTLISLDSWQAQQAVDEITESFVEAKEIEEAIEQNTTEPLYKVTKVLEDGRKQVFTKFGYVWKSTGLRYDAVHDFSELDEIVTIEEYNKIFWSDYKADFSNVDPKEALKALDRAEARVAREKAIEACRKEMEKKKSMKFDKDAVRAQLTENANKHVITIMELNSVSETSYMARLARGFKLVGHTPNESGSYDFDTLPEMIHALNNCDIVMDKEMIKADVREAQKNGTLEKVKNRYRLPEQREYIDSLTEAKELESAIASHQAEFEDTHPDLMYMKEKYNELPKEARDKIANYSFEQGCGPLPSNQLKRMYVELKKGWLNSYYADEYDLPRDYLVFTFEELEQGKLIEATKPEHFLKTVSEASFGPLKAQDERHFRATYEDPKEVTHMDTVVHRVEELEQTVRTRRKYETRL